MDKKQIVILLAVAVLFFVAGLGVGIFLQSHNKVQVEKIQATNNLSSKVVSSIVAYGQVKNITGRNITLSNLGDNLTISVAGNANVYAFAVPAGSKTSAPVQQTVEFASIKVGDNVNVAVKLSSTGQLQGSSVIILPNAK